MLIEVVVFLLFLCLFSITWFKSEVKTKRFLIKWLLASLVMPLCVLFLPHSLLSDEFVLFHWPSAIVLLALGGSEHHIWYVIYIWFSGVFLNMVLYYLLGGLVHLLFKVKRL
jgi:hypothetical protein